MHLIKLFFHTRWILIAIGCFPLPSLAFPQAPRHRPFVCATNRKENSPAIKEHLYLHQEKYCFRLHKPVLLSRENYSESMLIKGLLHRKSGTNMFLCLPDTRFFHRLSGKRCHGEVTHDGFWLCWLIILACIYAHRNFTCGKNFPDLIGLGTRVGKVNLEEKRSLQLLSTGSCSYLTDRLS